MLLNKVGENKMSNYIYYNGELYHYGVPGMKWGVRHDKDVADAKIKYKRAKEYLKRNGRHGDTSISSKAYTDMVKAKAEYNSLKVKNPKNSEKAYLKTYKKEFNKYGETNSTADILSGGISTRLYKDLAKNKGADVAEKVHKQVTKWNNVKLGAAVVMTAASAGLYAYLNMIEQ